VPILLDVHDVCSSEQGAGFAGACIPPRNGTGRDCACEFGRACIPPLKGEGGRQRRKGGLRPPFFQSRTPTQSVGYGGVPPTALALFKRRPHPTGLRCALRPATLPLRRAVRGKLKHRRTQADLGSIAVGPFSG
jgi:hypothetical protein